MADTRLLPNISFDNALLWIITGVSVALSAYCGWMMAFEQHVLVKIAMAGSFGTIALLLSTNTRRLAREHVRGNIKAYRSQALYCALLFLANLATDFGAASIIRDATFVTTKNVNVAAKQNLGEVKRIERRLGEIGQELGKLQSIKTPGYYEAQLVQLKSTLGADGRNIWQRSLQCADVTITESQDHCRDIAAAQGNMDLAVDKRRLQDERLALTTQLPKAKNKSQEVKEISNPVIAQIKNGLSIIMQTLTHTDGQIRWGILTATLFFTGIFSTIIFRESWGIAYEEAMAGQVSAPRAVNEWLPDERPEAPRETAKGQGEIHLHKNVYHETNMDVLKRAVAAARGMAA